MRSSHLVVGTSGLLALLSLQALAQNTTPLAGTLSKLPVREVTIFKDGHAFVLHEGSLPVDAKGELVLDNLPTPVVGTFWPYQVGGKLRGVVASREPVTTQRPALSVHELLKANVGADVTIIEGGTPEKRFDARILAVPQLPPIEAPPNEAQPEYRSSFIPQPAQAEVILLQTAEGVLARSLSSINQVIFKNPPRQTTTTPEFRNLMRLQLDGAQRAAGQPVNVGMVYLQKGLRWIPSYRLSLDGKGSAGVKMQATLVNELVDLQDATANFVIGVPSFALKNTVDPLSLQNTFARLSPLFEPTSRSAGAFDNAIQAQMASNSYRRINDDADEQPGNAAGIEDAGKNEDFFVFTAKNIVLKKGERMSFPLAQYELQYKDVYTLQTPAQPPIEVYRNFNYEQQNQVNQSLAAPKVMHQIRLSNTGTQPLTTAPALIESNGRLLAQTLMTYTASGGRSDLDLAPAVDVTVKRLENETKRTPNALKWQDDNFTRVDIGGRLVITSYRNEPITLEVTQQFIGTVEKAQSGVIRKLGLGDDDGGMASTNLPAWWNYHNGDWRAVNGLSSVKWTLIVPAKKSLELPYTYHYFWS
ncbi:MAG TPA: hypothetical protein VGB77_01610 [Abditibacteriaceae bacterium]|jgi:hypothetical protein